MKSAAFALAIVYCVANLAAAVDELHEDAPLRRVDSDVDVAFPPMGRWMAFGHGPRGGQMVATGNAGRWVAGGIGPKKAQWLAAGRRKASIDGSDDFADDQAMKMPPHGDTRRADSALDIAFPAMGRWVAFGHGPRGGQMIATGNAGRWVAGGLGPKKAQWLAAGRRQVADDAIDGQMAKDKPTPVQHHASYDTEPTKA
ncbi:unnamed protein product [Aphanomyces euteiches]|uniref:RxLR effector protein n=1 Tax=Aphanomyces euteiches TaxID=100861 RepID=A0A6G0WE01_9STRA|nr:hypothetical protein Ae201684_016523 [Aphanomyces euteiches]KAH9092760.1 hypothetical protein Ae201684P_008429 [Aphanomyces euteiches]KAH9143716.1 hypothetical protein AeRB84_012304 [Aphanomyces euteiches]